VRAWNERSLSKIAHSSRPHSSKERVSALRDRPFEAGREIVEHHYAFAGIDKRVNHVTSDIAGAAGDQDRHAMGPLARSNRPPLLIQVL
jgi:hypothetical protein